MGSTVIAMAGCVGAIDSVCIGNVAGDAGGAVDGCGVIGGTPGPTTAPKGTVGPFTVGPITVGVMKGACVKVGGGV